MGSLSVRTYRRGFNVSHFFLNLLKGLRVYLLPFFGTLLRALLPYCYPSLRQLVHKFVLPLIVPPPLDRGHGHGVQSRCGNSLLNLVHLLRDVEILQSSGQPDH